MSFETKVKPDYAQASFATEEEIRDHCSLLNHKRDCNEIDGGIVVMSDGKISYTINGDSSNMTVGSTGSKKSRNVVMPHILSCAHAGTSMILHDPKGDLYKNTKNVLEKAGYKIRVLDYRNPECGDRYNPLQYGAELYKAGNKDRAREIFRSFSDTIFESVKSEKDPFWHKTSSAYMAGLTELLCQLFPVSEVTIDNIYNLHLQGNEKMAGSNYMKIYFGRHKDERCLKLIYPVITAPEDTKNSLNAVFSGGLNVFVQNDAVVDQTSDSTFRVEDLVNEKTALFIISRDEGSVYDALITAIIDQIYSILVDIAEENGGCLDRKVCFLLDEFGNLAPLSNIEKKLTLSRARGISWHIVCQSLDQLSLVYGKERALIIIGNCNNIVYLYSPDIKLVKHISALCGERSGEILSDIKSPLCPVEMLRHLDKEGGECLMLLDRLHPFITRLPDISQYYGVEPIDKVDIKKRERQKLESIDFKFVVEQIRKSALQKITDDAGKKHEMERRKMFEQKEMFRMWDPYSVRSIIDGVIFELVEVEVDG